jgi:hypothetical protein
MAKEKQLDLTRFFGTHEKEPDQKTKYYIEKGKEWMFDSDYEEAAKIRRDFHGWLKERNEDIERVQKSDGFKSKLGVENKEQAVLWLTEIDGQISDGIWENDPRLMHNAWTYYTFATITLDGSGLKTSAYALPGVDITRMLREGPNLIGRMLIKVRESVNSNYTYKDLVEDINALARLVRRKSRI